MSDTLPEPWEDLLVSSGFYRHDRTRKDGSKIASLRALAEDSGVHPSSLSSMMSGKTRNPAPVTVTKTAESLGMNEIEFRRLVGLSARQPRPWTPPEYADLMTPKQRSVVESIIREFVREKDDQE